MGLTLAGAEGEHGRLPLPRRAPRHHQHLVQAGRLQFGQSQRFLAARHADGLPAPYHGSHFINLTRREEEGGGGWGGTGKNQPHTVSKTQVSKKLGKRHLFSLIPFFFQ